MKHTGRKKRSPLKLTQWRKQGLKVPRDKDGAYRVYNRLDGQNVFQLNKDAAE
jgi:hypothetical protein